MARKAWLTPSPGNANCRPLCYCILFMQKVSFCLWRVFFSRLDGRPGNSCAHGSHGFSSARTRSVETYASFILHLLGQKQLKSDRKDSLTHTIIDCTYSCVKKFTAIRPSKKSIVPVAEEGQAACQTRDPSSHACQSGCCRPVPTAIDISRQQDMTISVNTC